MLRLCSGLYGVDRLRKGFAGCLGLLLCVVVFETLQGPRALRLFVKGFGIPK